MESTFPSCCFRILPSHADFRENEIKNNRVIERPTLRSSYLCGMSGQRHRLTRRKISLLAVMDFKNAATMRKWVLPFGKTPIYVGRLGYFPQKGGLLVVGQLKYHNIVGKVKKHFNFFFFCQLVRITSRLVNTTLA